MTCEHCHGAIPDVLTFGNVSRMGRKRRFCSRECRDASFEARAAAQRQSNPRCAYCAQPSTRGRYCSERCERLALRGTHTGSSSDLPPAMIERIFQRAKQRIRYERALAQAGGER